MLPQRRRPGRFLVRKPDRAGRRSNPRPAALQNEYRVIRDAHGQTVVWWPLRNGFSAIGFINLRQSWWVAGAGLGSIPRRQITSHGNGTDSHMVLGGQFSSRRFKTPNLNSAQIICDFNGRLALPSRRKLGRNSSVFLRTQRVSGIFSARNRFAESACRSAGGVERGAV